MHIRSFGLLVVLAAFLLPSGAWAKPPDHAPAHGYRAKHNKHHKHDILHKKHHHHDRHAEGDRDRYEEHGHRRVPDGGGVEVIFDSERGVYVGVDLPNIFFHDGQYYRQRSGHWEVSVRGDGAWKMAAGIPIPIPIVDAGSRTKVRPVPASPDPTGPSIRRPRRR